jgi:hypothetical protein
MVPSLYLDSESAIPFVEEQLADGLTLASLVLRENHPLKGTAQLCVDDAGYSHDRELTLQDWHSGVGAKAGGGMECLVNVIHDFLHGSVNRLCIIENAVAKPSDAWLSNRQSQVAIYQQEIYHVLRGGPKRNEIERTIREAQSAWMMLGYLIDLPSIHEIGEVFSIEELDLLSRHVASCFIQAFDGEGYLLWEIGR